MYFEYGDMEKEYLKSSDMKLGAVIERIGHIYHPVDSDLFSSVIHHIIGQQISTKAQQTIWKRMNDDLRVVNADTIIEADREKVQGFGTTFIKADCILDFAQKVKSGEFDINDIKNMSDEESIKTLSSLKGIGTWTAEMILIFCLQRQDILSYGDLAILRGMRMVYRHRELTRERFEKYRQRLSAYNSVASLYFWKVAGGAIPEITDPAPRKVKK